MKIAKSFEIRIAKMAEEAIADCGFFLSSNDKEFNDEVMKYVCPCRMAVFLDENKEKYEEIDYLTQDRFEDGREVILIDLLSQTAIIDELRIEHCIGDYVAFSSHLDKYGNER